MDIEPVPDIPALVIRGRKSWVCIADLHLGIEAELRASGFNIPNQTKKVTSVIEALEGYADRMLILGDVKHRITHATPREDKDVRSVMDTIMRLFQAVVITPGNHDGGLRGIVPEGCIVTPLTGTVVEGAGTLHGHVWPSEEVMSAAKVITAHIHPSILLEDSLGGRANEKCWMRAAMRKEKARERYRGCPDEMIVVPAFNPLITGTPINVPGGGRLSPLLRNGFADDDTVTAYLLNGTNLGRPSALSPRKRASR
ncbi:MAG: metallophosphoesterase [Methanobacteriota archaeon]|nr:MAG: metallophosphoesterase [Euryarchaeota archaeon]